MNPPNEVELAAYVGLDWADRRHVICLQATGSRDIESRKLDQKPDALHDWIAQLRVRFAGAKVGIAIEQSRGAAVHALMMYDFLIVYPINPKALARYREAFRVSGAKDDPSDAELLMDLLRFHRHRLRAWLPDTVETRRLQMLIEYRRKLVNNRIRHTNRITSLLKMYFPQGLDWAGELGTMQACDFLYTWPTLRAVQQTTAAQLRDFYLQHRCRNLILIEQRLTQIPTARPLTDDPAITEPLSWAVQVEVAQLRPVLESIPRLDQLIAQQFALHPEHELFESFPGAGPVYAPRLLTAFGTDPRPICNVIPASLQSPSRAEIRVGFTAAWPAPTSSAKPFMSSPLSRSAGRPGLALATIRCASAVYAIPPPSALWLLNGFE
jgi:hypothetical protein